MALDPGRAADAYIAAQGLDSDPNKADIRAGALNMITSILDEIKNNGVVSTSVPGTGLTGYSGTPISGAATGTGTIS